MILAIDIGNTTVALAGIKDGRVCFVAHIDTLRGATAADYRPRIARAFSGAKHQPVRVEGAILTSVVPELTEPVSQCAAEYCPGPPLIVSPGIRSMRRLAAASSSRSTALSGRYRPFRYRTERSTAASMASSVIFTP